MARKPGRRRTPLKPADELHDDEVDDFHAVRERMRDYVPARELEGGGAAAAAAAEDEDEEEDEDEDEDEDERLQDPLQLGGGHVLDDDDDGEDEDEEGEDDDELDDFRPPGARLGLDEDEMAEEAEEEARRERASRWGKGRGNFYGADDVDEDEEDIPEDERADKLEEDEARRLQAEQLALIEEDDYEDLATVAAARTNGAVGTGRARTTSATAAGRAVSALAAVEGAFGTAALRANGVVTMDRAACGASSGAGGVGERDSYDPEPRSAEDRRRIVERDSPELLDLLADLKAKLDETRARIAPLVDSAAAGTLRVGGGVGFLRTKLQILVAYCASVAFYLALRAGGGDVSDHPVIVQLVRLRTVLEKLGPLDKKLHYQVDRLLALARADADGAAAAGAGRQGPNPGALLTKGSAREERAAGVGGADGARETLTEPARTRARGDTVDVDGVYKPPKLAAVEYDEAALTPEGKRSRKAERDMQRRLDRTTRSALVRELRNEFGDEPEEMAATDIARGLPRGEGSAAAERLAREEEERRHFEEDHFVRMQLTKAQKKAQRRLAKAGGADMLERLDDITPLLRDGAAAAHAAGIDLASIGVDDSRGVVTTSRRKGRADAAAALQARGAGIGEKRGSGDGDVLLNHSDAAGLGLGDDGDDDAGGDLDDPETEAMYEAMAERKRAKRAARQATREAMLEAVYTGSADEDGDGMDKRAVGYDIAKNRGLTKTRKKIDRNARTKNREKYRRAVIRRKGQVREMAPRPAGEYGGEATGIKKNVTHSRRFAG